MAAHISSSGSLDKLSDDATLHKAKPVALHHPPLVCVKPPPVEPTKEKPKQKGRRHPVLITDPEKLLPVMMTPSQFLAELRQTTEERLANTYTMRLPRKMTSLEMDKTLVNKQFRVSRKEPLFQPFPSEMYFQNFVPLQTYRLPLVLRNNDIVSRHVRVTQFDSPYFRVVSPAGQVDKAGPGISLTFDIYFLPNEYKDYGHELTFITERESFVVPIYAIGTRAFLDFPDNVHFPMCAVKHPASKTFLIHNIGNREAKFTLKMEKTEKGYDPFSVSPEVGNLSLEESMQVSIEFLPNETGNHHGKLIIAYDTGEKLQVTLYGAARDVNIRLNKKSLYMTDTYVSKLSKYTISIFNYSDIITHFRWTQFATKEEEDQQKLLYHIEIGRDEHWEVYAFLEECKYEPKETVKVSALHRTFHNKHQAVNNRLMLFEDDVIRFDPVEGEVWPNSSIDVSIIFHPVEAVHYTRVAFCEVTGRQSRLPLRIRGDGIGPKLDFSFEELDIGNIFVGSENVYELVVWNKGDIEATYNIVPNFSDFGPFFEFEPADGTIMAGDYQAIRITFFSTDLGTICEHFQFQVSGTSEKKDVVFKGCVIAPFFRFSVPKVEFGTVSYGFPCKRTFHLINSSVVPISYRLRIPSDGSLHSIHAMGDLDPKGKSAIPLHGLPLAKEFDIQPSSGSVAARSSVKVEVTLTSNHAQVYDEMLVVDVKKVGRETQGLPLRARCIIPPVIVVTPELDLGRCCLRYSYERKVLLQNDSSWPAAYILTPQERSEENAPTIWYQSSQPRGIVPANSTLAVPIEIQVQKLATQEVTCYFAIFGSQEPPLQVQLRCNGEGPVVHLDPSGLQWGNIPVLQSVAKTLVMSNQSKIPCLFSTMFVQSRNRSPFSVSPEKGEIPPESSTEIVVTAYLDDCLNFQSTLQLNFVESDSRRVHLEATGEGTTIVSHPLLLPVMDLGPHFCKSPITRTFKLTNKGRRHHQITWSTEGFSWSRARQMNQGTKNGKKKSNQSKGKSQALDMCRPVFNVTPARFNLRSGQSIDFMLEACVAEPRSVSEVLMCHAVLGNSANKDVIMRVEVSAVFVCPILEFSSKSILFHVEKLHGLTTARLSVQKPQDKLEVLEQHLQFSNVSSLPLSITMVLRYPFSILLSSDKTADCKELYLPHNEKHDLTLHFDPNYKMDLHSRTVEDILSFSYKEHSHVDTISLRGEVHFPNLQFERTAVNFGCILNDTEVTRFVSMKNISPLRVKYRWSFFVDPTQSQVKRVIRPKVPAVSLSQQDVINAEREKLSSEVSEEEEKLLPEAIDAEHEKVAGEVSGEVPEVMNAEQEKLACGASGEEGKLLPTDAQQTQVGAENDAERNVGTEEQEASPQMELTVFCADLSIIKEEESGPATWTPPSVTHECSKDKRETIKLFSVTSVGSHLAHNLKEAELLSSNPVLMALMEEDNNEAHTLGVEEVFDILPLFGMLEPGESEQVTFTFFGHANVVGEVKARCEVEGGPDYELMITGEASVVEYHFELTELDFGKQLYESVGVKELTLVNMGRVPFKFYALDIEPVKLDIPKPGQPELVPHSGTMDPFSEQKLQVRFLPGVPGSFSKHFSIQVAHFEPDVIHIHGEGVFPRISLDLPRYIEDQGHQSLLIEACRNLMPGSSDTTLDALTTSCLQDFRQRVGASVPSNTSCNLDALLLDVLVPTDQQIQSEMEQLAVRHFAEQRMAAASMCMLSCEGSEKLASSTVSSCPGSQVPLPAGDKEKDSALSCSKKPKPRLPKYLLDFGYVVRDTQKSLVVLATNTGWSPVSFKVKRAALKDTGFVVGLDKVHHLPGAPDNETVDFIVTFDPKAADVPIGPVEVTVPIDILHGPMVELCLRASVTVPSMQLSQDCLDFQEVKCGECRIMVFRLCNHQHVSCSWVAITNTTNKTEHVRRYTPLHLRRKVKVDKSTVPFFEVFPASGILQPGYRTTVQVKFIPKEQKWYEETFYFKIAQSSEQLPLVCRGQGLEPCLEFAQSLIHFPSILPLSGGESQTLNVSNPCSFPIEFCCLEYDLQYLGEEKVLRRVQGYDDFNMLLLPPRTVGDKLPSELLAYYEERRTRQEEEESVVMEIIHQTKISSVSEYWNRDDEQERRKLGDGVNMSTVSVVSPQTQADIAAEVTALEKEEAEDQGEPVQEAMPSSTGVGQVETNPVLTAIASYLGIDLSTQGRTACINPGLGIIVHGSPFSGKSVTAITLAQQYDAAVVTLDGAVMEAITNGSSMAALKARELCEEAARLRAEELKMLEEMQAECNGPVCVHSRGSVTNPHNHHTHHAGETKMAAGAKTKDRHAAGSKSTAANSGLDGTGSNQPPSGPRILSQQLSITGLEGVEDGLASCCLPEDILVDILVERLQLEDCLFGVVFDGLESLFVPCLFTAANAILKAMNNSRYIFFCTLKLDYVAFQEREKETHEAREKQAKQVEELELQRIEEMEEDEYDALSQEEKDRIDQARLNLKKLRIKREQEEKEKKEREREEERRKMEEHMKNKKGSKRKYLEPQKGTGSQMQMRSTDSSVADMRSDKTSEHESKRRKTIAKGHGKKADVVPVSSEPSGSDMENIPLDPAKEAENLLLKRFEAFENAHRDLCDLLDQWDRTTQQLHHPQYAQEVIEEEPTKKGRGKGEKGEKEKDRHAGPPKKAQSIVEVGPELLEGEAEEEVARVPHIQIDCSDHSAPVWQRILDTGLLPSKEEVLEGMGLGPEGPPLPPPVTLAAVPYPAKRKPRPLSEHAGRFVFVDSLHEELTSLLEEKGREVDVEEDKPEVTKGKGSTRSGRSTPDSPIINKLTERRKTPHKLTYDKEAISPTTQTWERSSVFRWVVPAQGQTMLHIHFSSAELGQFEQLYRFEIVGTRRQYQVMCKGTCAFPTISKDPRIVFSSRKKSMEDNAIVHKKFIHSTQMFEFGPLLVGVNREKNPNNVSTSHDNCEVFNIHNPTEQVAEVSFCLLQDIKGATFQLDKVSANLGPGETMPLKVCATPKSPGRFEDALICCVRENPEPVIFTIACDGVRPELVLDKKTFHFDKVLIHRKDTKVIFLRNPTLLPAAWRLVGLETMGEDFLVGADKGILEPLSDFALCAYFRAVKPVLFCKRMIRLEVSDVDDALGVVQSEPIQIIAEAYDVSLDMNFASGASGGVDFGTVRVNDDVKETITLKNKGKYECTCQFMVEKDDPKLASLFSFSPAKVNLNALEKPVQVAVNCKCTHEMNLKDIALFKCHISEPSQGGNGELIAIIPIKMSIKSVYSRFTILPSTDINFGYLLVNAKKTRILAIHNEGDFEFKFTVCRKADNDRQIPAKKQPMTVLSKKSKRASLHARAGMNPHGRKDFSRWVTVGDDFGLNYASDSPSGRLVSGIFTIYPAAGIINPNSSCNVSIDCIADREGLVSEELVINIAECDPKVIPSGIPYKLIAEGCSCALNTDDVASIFEEHHVYQNLLQLPSEIESVGVYGEEERRFVFSHVLVGKKAKARFKISNISKIPYEVVMTLRLPPQKGGPKVQQVETFEVEPQRATVIGHGYVFVTVSFTPTSMQAFSTVFEAAIDSMNRAKTLVFEVAGEGTLPMVSITQPTIKNSQGQPVLLFSKILVGRSQTLPLTLFNSGFLPCKVDVDLLDAPEEVFRLLPAATQQLCESSIADAFYGRVHTASLILGVGETASLRVVYQPHVAERSQALVKVSVVDNPYEDLQVELVGEGHQDDITIDNVTRPTPTTIAEGSAAEEDESALVDIDVSESHHLAFGDCPIDVPRTLTFTMTSHSKSGCVRFTWPHHPLLIFSPREGHLHAGCTKDVTLTFMTSEPTTLTEEVVTGRVVEVTFDVPVEQVTDWDDRVKAIKWVDVQGTPDAPATRPLKRKVVEIETEPAHSEVLESVRDLELMVSALAEYSRFSCTTTSIHFKDTLMFQTRFYEFTLENSGMVTLDFSWQITMDQVPSPLHHSLTSLGEGESRGSLSSVRDMDDMSFCVEPEWGNILPGKAAVVRVKFSPLYVGDYAAFLVCSMSNLEADSVGPVIYLQGHSLLPVCHFDLQDSDYISGLRRNPGLPGPKGAPSGCPLDPNTRVVECYAVGMKVACLREFHIVNPTNTKYHYEWVCEDKEEQQSLSSFKCLYMQGHIDSGRRVKVGFKFVAGHLGVEESFWRFNVASRDISIPFLLVGHTREPIVFFNKAHIAFKPLLIGKRDTEEVSVINKENTTLSFQFVHNSCHTEGYDSQVTVDPMSGQIAPNSRVTVKVTFVPTLEKEVNFNLICKIQHRVGPVMLNVKAEGYIINCKLQCQDSTGKKLQLSARGINYINFGNVNVKEAAVRQLLLCNSSKSPLDYSWQLSDCAAVHQGLVHLLKDSGSIASGDSEPCTLTYCPSDCGPLRACQLTLKVSKGPKYSVAVTGQGVLPGLQLSFHSHDFGSTFVKCPGESPPTATLTLTNTDTKDISVCCLYTPTLQLTYDFKACVLGAMKNVSIPFTFCPPEAGHYREMVVFEVNGASQRTVEFSGSGCNVRVEVADKKHKLVNLGSCFVGDAIRKEIPIVNYSPAPITFQLLFSPSSRKLTKVGLLKVTAPKEPVTLSANGGSVPVEVFFQPKGRITSFTEQVMMQYGSLSRLLFAVSGECLGMDIKMDTSYITFGTVFLRSQTSRKLTLTNQGDINTRFHWDMNHFLPDFSISPIEGYIAPGMDITFDINFHPQNTTSDIRYENLQCFLDGGPQAPLTLTLTGSCTDITPMKEAYSFSTVVRGKDTKSIPIYNRTFHIWQLVPIIEGDQWSGPTTLTVEPQQTRTYDITYRPLTMTVDLKHQGTVFFPFPDGLGQLYNLVGTADAPKSSGKVAQDVPCKTDFTQLLSVHNWLTKPQRFQAKIEVIKSDKADASLKISGMDYIDVPASSRKLYKFQIYAYREGLHHLKATFTHEPSGEYQFYDVQVRFTKPGVISVIDLSTPVRHTVRHEVPVENPLSYQVAFNVACTLPDVMAPSPFIVAPLSKGFLSFYFIPLKVGEVQGKLELSNFDLGLFAYDLVLRATPASLEKTVHMRVPLGQSQVQTVHFHSFSKVKTEYGCKVDSPDILVDRNVSVPAAVAGSIEATVDLTFEPSKLGEQQTTLTISSPVGGDYIFPVLALCTTPTPIGPIPVKSVGYTPISFRNVFLSTVTFDIQDVNSPLMTESVNSWNLTEKVDFSGVKTATAYVPLTTVPCTEDFDNSSQTWIWRQDNPTVHPLSRQLCDATTRSIQKWTTSMKNFRRCMSHGERCVWMKAYSFGRVDSSHFHVQKQSETIRSKKEARIQVTFDGNKESKATVASRMVVSCTSPNDGVSTLQWVYYLKGFTPRREDINQKPSSSQLINY